MKLNGWIRPAITAAILLLVVLYPVITFNASAPLLSTSTAPDGLHSLREIASSGSTFVSIISSPVVLNDVHVKEKNLYLGIGVSREITREEMAALSGFLTRGGNVLIADDSTGANPLLSYLLSGQNSSITFSGHRVLSEYNAGNPEMPLVNATLFIRSRGNMSTHTVVLNGATSLLIGGDVQIISRSNRSFVDYNDNGVVDADEKENAITMAMADVGKGRLLVISDPDMFTNEMIYRQNNSDFVKDIVADLANGGIVYCDDSLHSTAFTIAGYTIMVSTTYPYDLLSTSIILLISYIAVILVRDPEIWEHKYRPDRFIPRPEYNEERRRELRWSARAMELAAKRNLTIEEAEQKMKSGRHD